MPRREHHYRWEWRLRSSAADLWPLVADTNRFNRDAGVPALEVSEPAQRGRRLLRLRKLGIPIEWEEEPFEWIRPHRFSVVRRYRRGPLEEMRVVTELLPEGDGTLLVYEMWARPRNLLGRVAIPVEIGRSSARRFERTFRRYDELAQESRAHAAEAHRLAPHARRRLAAGRERLVAEALAAGLVERLVELLEHGDDLTLGRLRPYALAAAWSEAPREVLELFLHATRAGLVEFRWDLLCPMCRGPAQRAETLAAVDAEQHCASCGIDFHADFAQSVELTFRPSPAIREVPALQFCVGGPQVTPHILVQQLVEPGGERLAQPMLEPGTYRLRLAAGPLAVAAAADGARAAEVRAGDAAHEPLVVAKDPALRLVNDTAHEHLFVLERTAWSDQAVTAAEVTALQVFRDLFAAEALRPGEPISVGTLTVLFTDLRDSTRFYREIGDARAFGSVMDHLDVLRAAVAAEDGALVKAMGDAILAVFRTPVAAVRAALAAQRALAEPRSGRPPFRLKAGIHTGHCIAVTQNERLDYFGSTVNLAARLVTLSSGDDVVVSSAVTADPEVEELVGGPISAAPVSATLKGFEEEELEIWRLVVLADRREAGHAALAAD